MIYDDFKGYKKAARCERLNFVIYYNIKAVVRAEKSHA